MSACAVMGGTLSKPDPSRTIEVIGVGAARTGSCSLQIALERLLDGPVYHAGSQVWRAPDEARNKLWAQACDAKYVEKDKERTLKFVREAVKGYAGCSDVPVHCFIPELLELFPNAKVILTTRDPQKWAESFETAFGLVGPNDRMLTMQTFFIPGLRWVPKMLKGYVTLMDGIARDAGHEPTYRGPEFINAWNERIIKIVPKERLLVMEIKEGWEPLAKFLGKPVPDEPFPCANERETIKNHGKGVVLYIMTCWMGAFSVVGATAYLGWRAFKR